MTILNKNFFISILLILIGLAGFAQNEPPVPQAKGPPAPGLPIDNGIIILFVVALIYGIYIIIKPAKRII